MHKFTFHRSIRNFRRMMDSVDSSLSRQHEQKLESKHIVPSNTNLQWNRTNRQATVASNHRKDRRRDSHWLSVCMWEAYNAQLVLNDCELFQFWVKTVIKQISLIVYGLCISFYSILSPMLSYMWMNGQPYWKLCTNYSYIYILI